LPLGAGLTALVDFFQRLYSLWPALRQGTKDGWDGEQEQGKEGRGKGKALLFVALGLGSLVGCLFPFADWGVSKKAKAEGCVRRSRLVVVLLLR
jgi:hypothetical protein